ncbi:MAG: prolipoprotein diacylglyceryl transferase family protein [Tumebacillaceae bacterium]
MSFPVYIHIGPLMIHPHWLFETLSYFIGFRVYLYTRNKERIPMDKAMWVIVGAILGAALGSKMLYWFEDPLMTLDHLTDPVYLMEGKTIVGGLLGGLIGVELAKKLIGWTRSTGDDFALPLIVGMMIGRIGCFLTGLSDHTYGTPTTWITGVDFGDGILRHPTQLYEIAFLLSLGILLFYLKRQRLPEGTVFQLFMIGYLAFRLLIDFIKPTPHSYLIFNNVQMAAIFGLIYYSRFVRRWRRGTEPAKENAHA